MMPSPAQEGRVLFVTDRLLVREFVWEDWHTTHAYAQLPEVSQYQYWGPNNEVQTQSFLKDALRYQTERPRRRYEWCVCLHDATHIGGCSLFIESPKAKRALVGYLLHPAYWGQGLATELTAHLLVYGHHTLRMKHFGAMCDTRNIASQRVLEKNGFQQTERQEYGFLKKNSWQSTFYYTYSFRD